VRRVRHDGRQERPSTSRTNSEHRLVLNKKERFVPTKRERERRDDDKETK
jgi:hypothetical protein